MYDGDDDGRANSRLDSVGGWPEAAFGTIVYTAVFLLQFCWAWSQFMASL